MTLKNKARKGARFENALLNIAMRKGATFAMRGASSKCRSNDKALKIDIVIVKAGRIYFIQAKNHKQKATLPEIKRFGQAMYDASLSLGNRLTAESAFIESEEELERLLG